MMRTNKAGPPNKQEEELLYLLIEEAGEVIKAATKSLRHGFESRDPTKLGGPTNRAQLEKELGDLKAAKHRLYSARALDQCSVDLQYKRKLKAGTQYLRYS